MQVFLFLSLIFLVSCSHLMPHQDLKSRRLVLEKKWVRNVLITDYLGFRHPQRMTPIVTAGSVIQGNAIDGISKYDRQSGNLIWNIPLKNGVEAGAVLVGNYLFFGANTGFFYCADATTGKLVWTFPVRADILSTPKFENGSVYFVAGNNKLYSLSAESGKENWVYSRRDTSNISVRGGSQPEINGDLIYAGFSDGYVVALHKKTGKIEWEKLINENKRFKDVDAHPVISDNNVYVSGFDGDIYCLDKMNGNVLWKSPYGGFSGVVLNNDMLYASTSTGAVVALNKETGKLIWKYDLKDDYATRPVLYKGLLLFGEYHGDLKVLDSHTGKLITLYSPGRGIMSSPDIDSKTGDLFFFSVNANLYAFHMGWKLQSDLWPWEQPE